MTGSAILNLNPLRMPMTPDGHDRKKVHKQMPWVEWDSSLPRIVLVMGWTLPISRYLPQPVYRQVVAQGTVEVTEVRCYSQAVF